MGFDPAALRDSTATQALAEIARLARMATSGAVPDAIRRCRRLAAAMDAAGFALFFAGRGADAARLVACFDEEFPGQSRTTAALIRDGAEALSRHALRSALPAMWGPGENDGEGSTFVLELPVLLDGVAGLALPVAAESGQAGLFVFTGGNLPFRAGKIAELHRECCAMFAAVTAVRTGSTSASAVSRRELECLRLTAAGRTSEDIARILGLSVHTANQYLTSAGVKLDAVNRMHAVAKAMRAGLIE